MKELVESTVIFTVSIFNEQSDHLPEMVLGNALFSLPFFENAIKQNKLHIIRPDLDYLNEDEETKYVLGFYTNNNSFLKEINLDPKSFLQKCKDTVLKEQENLSFKLHNVVLENKYTTFEKFEV